MKKFVCSLALVLLCSVCAGAVEVWVDGAPVDFPDVQPFADETGHTLVPLRPVADALGLTTRWDQQQKTAVFSRRYTPEAPGYLADAQWDQYAFCDRSLTMTVGYAYSERQIGWQPRGEEETMQPNQTFLSMSAVPVLREGRVCAPVRALAERFFCAVGWNGIARRVEIVTDTMVERYLAAQYGARLDWSESDKEGWTCKLYFDKTPPQWTVSYSMDCTQLSVGVEDGVSTRKPAPASDYRSLRELTADELGSAAWGAHIAPIKQAAADAELYCAFTLTLSAGGETQYVMRLTEYLDDPADSYRSRVYWDYQDKRHARGEVSLTEQARVLESLGVRCPPADELRRMKQRQDEWIQQMQQTDPGGGWEEMRYESPDNAYVTLLDVIGGGAYDRVTHEFLGYSSDQVWAFDWERMEVLKMYTEVLGELERLGGGAFAITAVTEQIDEEALDTGEGKRTVSFCYNGSPHTLEVNHMGDFMDSGFFAKFNAVLEQEGSPKRFLLYDSAAGGLLLYNTEQWAQTFEETTLTAPSLLS